MEMKDILDRPARAVRPGVTLVLLAGGPAAVALAAGAWRAGAGHNLPLWAWLTGIAVAFSPLPVGLPAVLCDTDRDSTLPAAGAGSRSMRMLPRMLRATGGVATETAAGLVGFTLTLAAIAGVLHPMLSL